MSSNPVAALAAARLVARHQDEVAPRPARRRPSRRVFSRVIAVRRDDRL